MKLVITILFAFLFVGCAHNPPKVYKNCAVVPSHGVSQNSSVWLCDDY